MPRRKRKPTREGAVLRMFLDSLDLTAEELASKAQVTAETVGLWKNGKVPLDHDRLVQALGCVGVPPEAVDEALFSLELGHPHQGPTLPTEPSSEERARIHQMATACGRRVAQIIRIERIAASHRRTAREHRAWAAERWPRLVKHPAEKQERLIRGLFGDEKSWALAERLCHASTAAAAHQASEALRLARLGVQVAEQSPGPELWRLRLLGWCLCFLANAIRVSGDLDAAEETFSKAEVFWTQGATGDPYGLLDGARRLDLRASLRRQQGHFEETLTLLEQALAGSPPEAAARLLIKKAATHTRAGDYERALRVLEAAEPRVDEQRDQRLFFLHRSNTALALCHLDRYEAAEPLVPLVEALAADVGNELDRERAAWLKGKIWAGLGRREEALALLSRVRRYFHAKKIAYDFALASLEVAVLHLEQGRTRLVQVLAEEMLWIFKTQKVHKEALAALTLFCQVAEEELAEVRWTRHLIRFLYRAQHNPRLHFKP